MNIEKKLKISMSFVATGMIVYGLAYAFPSISNLIYYANTIETNNLNILEGGNILALSIIISIYGFLFTINIKKYFIIIDLYILIHFFVGIIEIILVLTGKVTGLIILLQISYDIIIPLYLYFLKEKYRNFYL